MNLPLSTHIYLIVSDVKLTDDICIYGVTHVQESVVCDRRLLILRK